jgi:hypothetical protein
VIVVALLLVHPWCTLQAVGAILFCFWNLESFVRGMGHPPNKGFRLLVRDFMLFLEFEILC